MKEINELHQDAASEAVLFDVRIPGVAEQVHKARAIYQEEADLEFLDENHAVLLIRPGNARRRA